MSEAIAIVIGATQWEGEQEEGVISNWFFADGAAVKAGQVIAEIMVEKVEMELFAPESGILRILMESQSIIVRGSKIGEIRKSGT